MSMHVEAGKESLDGMQVENPLFYGINLRMLFWIWIYVKSVQVDTIFVCSVMSSVDSVWIDDGHKVEHEFISKETGNFSLSKQSFQNPIHDVAGRHLSWMHSSTNKYAFFVRMECSRSVTSRKQQLIF